MPTLCYPRRSILIGTLACLVNICCYPCWRTMPLCLASVIMLTGASLTLTDGIVWLHKPLFYTLHTDSTLSFGWNWRIYIYRNKSLINIKDRAFLDCSLCYHQIKLVSLWRSQTQMFLFKSSLRFDFPALNRMPLRLRMWKTPWKHLRVEYLS